MEYKVLATDRFKNDLKRFKHKKKFTHLFMVVKVSSGVNTKKKNLSLENHPPRRIWPWRVIYLNI